MRTAQVYAICAMLLLNGCENTQGTLMPSPNPAPVRLPSPDPSFRLDAAERSKILPGFDAGALERLLSRVTPEVRTEILQAFQVRKPGERRGHIVSIHDPVLQAILEEVWAPMWDNVPDDALEQGLYSYPGREIAKQRRRDSKP